MRSELSEPACRSPTPIPVTIIHHVGVSGHSRRSHRLAVRSASPQASSIPGAPTPSNLISRIWRHSMPAKGYAKAHAGTSTFWVLRDEKVGKGNNQPQDGSNLSNPFIHQGKVGLNSAGCSQRSHESPNPPEAVTPAFSALSSHNLEGGEGSDSLLRPHGGAQKPHSSHPYPSFCLSCPDYWSNRYYPRCCWHAGPQCLFGRLGAVVKRLGVFIRTS